MDVNIGPQSAFQADRREYAWRYNLPYYPVHEGGLLLPLHRKSIPPAPDAEHLQVGKSMAEVGVQPTTDLYGQGPEQHGSAWKADIAQLKPIETWLRRKGYRPFGKYTHKRGKVQIDLGKDASTVYLYITDDNKP